MRWASVLMLCAAFFSKGTLCATTLYEVIQSTLEQYPGLQAEDQRVAAAEARVRYARSFYSPQIYSGASAGVSEWQVSGLGRVTRYPRSAQVTLSQPVYRGGRTEAAIGRSLHALNAQEYLYEEAIQQLILDTALLYVDLLQEKEVLVANRNNRDYLYKESETIKDRYNLGDVTQTDLEQAKARQAESVALVKQAEDRVIFFKASLERFSGKVVDDLEPPTFQHPYFDSIDAFIEQILDHNNRYLAQKQIYFAALKNIREIQGEKYPEVSLNGLVVHGDDLAPAGFYSNQALAEVSVSFPLYQGDRINSQIAEARALACREALIYEELKRILKEAAVLAWNRLDTAKFQIVSYEAQVKASRVALDGVHQEESAGTRTIIDVLNAEQEVFNASLNLIRAKREKFAAELEIMHLLSSLDLDDFIQKSIPPAAQAGSL